MTYIITSRASDFLATLGVNTHIPYTDGLYSSTTSIAADLAYLGINQVRDGISDGTNGSAPLSSFLSLAQQGIHFTFGVEGSSEAALLATLKLVDQVAAAAPGSITAIEGANEVNNWPVTFDGTGGLDGAVAMQRALYAAVGADHNLPNVPVDYFTGYAAGAIGVGPDPSKVAGLADADTQHPYVLEGQAPAWWVSRSHALGNTSSSNAPAVYTETGYSSNSTQNDGVSQAVQAKYTLDLLLDAASQGISKTYLYDLMDAYAPGSPQGDDGFGLFDSNGAPKTVATAIHNLTSLLKDTGATAGSFQSTPLQADITGLPASGNSLAFQKSNGTTMLAVWAEPTIWNNNTHSEIAAAAQTVSVTLPRSYAGIQIFDPLVGTTPIATFTNTAQISFALTDHPILIELDPTASTIRPSVQGPSTDVLSLGVSEDAYQGDAQFTVAVDGHQVGGVQTATASHGAGQNQTVTLTGSFGSGVHVVTVDFVNDAWGGSSATDRNLYVNSLTYDGATTVVNAAQLSNGPVNYMVQGSAAPAVAVPVPPTIAITTQTLVNDAGASQTDNITKDGRVTLAGTVSGASGTAVELYDGAVKLGAASVHTDGTWSFATTLSSGVHHVTASATDPSGATATCAALAAVTVQTSPPLVAITAQTLASDTGASATDNITSNGAITLAGTVGSALATTVTIYDGGTALGSAVLGNAGTWTFATVLAAGAHSLSAVATDLAGNSATATAPAHVTVMTAKPTIALGTQSLSADGKSAVLTGTVSGPAGVQVTIANGSTPLGNATLDGKGGWTYAAVLPPGSYNLTAQAIDPAGNNASITPTVTIPAASAIATPAASLATLALLPALPAQPDTLTLNLSEDAYLGDAAFSMTVDGTSIGGVQSVTALRKLGQSQNFTVTGNFGSGSHVVAVNFLNDAWGGTADTDRNLYVNSMTLDGKTTVLNVSQLWQGQVTYKIATPVMRTLSVYVSEDAYKGDAQFSISVDGQTIGGPQTVTASHAAGQTQRFDLVGDFAQGTHSVAVDFLNDAWGGTATTDRNLYVQSMAIGGETTTTNRAQMSGGTVWYDVQAPAPASATTASIPTLTVATGSTLILDTQAFAGSVATFAGPNATLQLSSTAFRGSLAGFATSDTLDLRAVGFGASTSLLYTSGALTVSDGVHGASLALKGAYAASQFHMAADGQGGTAITLT